MSRHNRRRTRGGHKDISILQRTFDNSVTEPFASSSEPVTLTAPRVAPGGRSGASALQWHNRYMAWQVRERRQREESATLEAEKLRIFGEEDGTGEDEVLCVRMLEYFGGLDFIDG